MLLNEIIRNAPSIEIKQLSCDSRIPMKDCIFFCIKGIKYDGHNYVEEAIKNGAKVIIYSENINTQQKAIFIKVSDVLSYLIKISNIFYNYPQTKLFTYLISGTYGRPAVSHIIDSILSNYKKVGSIGVYGIKYAGLNLVSQSSTLTLLDTQKYLSYFVKEGVESAILEVNNISYDYQKLNFLKPNIFVYTNTSQDKLKKKSDYIATIQKYLYTLDDSTLIVLNKDDIAFNDLYKATGTNVVTYGKDLNSDYVLNIIHTSLTYSVFSIKHNNQKVDFKTNLIGEANIYNCVASIVTLAESGIDLYEISAYLAEVDQVPGIYERVNTNKYNIFIDAAFYKESYETIMAYMKKNTEQKLISVISISSTDDKNRISNLMSIAEKYSDNIILTEDSNLDNKIIDTFELCEKYLHTKPYLLIEDRVSAIESAIDLLNSKDTLLILGKGNEEYINKEFIKKKYEGDVKVCENYLKKIENDLLNQDYDY